MIPAFSLVLLAGVPTELECERGHAAAVKFRDEVAKWYKQFEDAHDHFPGFITKMRVDAAKVWMDLAQRRVDIWWSAWWAVWPRAEIEAQLYWYWRYRELLAKGPIRIDDG